MKNGKKLIHKTLPGKRVRAQRIVHRFSIKNSEQNSTVVCKSLRLPSIFYLKYTINQFCAIYVVVGLFKVIK